MKEDDIEDLFAIQAKAFLDGASIESGG